MFAFLPLAKIEVSLGQALASNSPPDCCIELFKSVRPVSPKRKHTPFGVRFLFVISVHFRYHFSAAKINLSNFKHKIFRSQVSTSLLYFSVSISGKLAGFQLSLDTGITAHVRMRYEFRCLHPYKKVRHGCELNTVNVIRKIPDLPQAGSILQ